MAVDKSGHAIKRMSGDVYSKGRREERAFNNGDVFI